MANGITISGLDDCLRWCDKAPESLLKATKQALKEASRASAKRLKQRTPPRWRKMIKTKVVKLSNGKMNASFGYYNGHQKGGHQGKDEAWDWFKAYWNNYGTLSLRDPAHEFEKPIKHAGTAAAKARRNNKGIPAQKFFEAGAAGYENTFVETFEQSLARQIEKLYDR